MDIVLRGLRDRRLAASDETRSVKNAPLYSRQSNARNTGADGAEFDRNVDDIYSIILHQTSGSFFDTERRSSRRSLVPSADNDNQRDSDHDIDRIGAHFVVMNTGHVFYTHDIQFTLSDNRYGTVEIEFAGKYNGTNRLPLAAIIAGRLLIRSLVSQVPSIAYIHPHGQVQTRDRGGLCGGGTANTCNKIGSCPGPDIWLNVGEWAANQLSLTCNTTHSRLQNNGISRRQTRSQYRRQYSANELIENPALARSPLLDRRLSQPTSNISPRATSRYVGPVGVYDHDRAFDQIIEELRR